MDKQELFDAVRAYFNENIPFNRHLGIDVTELSLESVRIGIEMRPELLGNGIMKSLHGGVTATLLDVSGGLAAIVHSIDKFDQLDATSLFEKLKTLGTIDMRVDYLLPGRGTRFEATATVVRHGRKVCVTRMELHNELEEQIALGTATYIVG